MRAIWQENIARLVGDEHGRRKKIAKAADMSPSQFSDLINKPDRNPQLKQIERIAGALGVPLGSLFVSGSTSVQGAHDAAVGVAPDSSVTITVADAIRAAFRDVLTEMLEAVAESDESAHADDGRRAAGDQQVPTPRAGTSTESRDPARHSGAVHRRGA